MSSKGQVVIPSRIRKEIGAERDEVFFVHVLEPDTIVLKKLDRREALKIFREIRVNSIKTSPEDVHREIEAYKQEQRAKGRPGY